ncbi:hypothetical protein HPB48_026139 [Haemaphysalis longicornis]|uniref:MAM domain-containing protein n=1 Tax=Haemaphysalis longicornis TaxID=44386 RepID=A0A9J6HAP1_HAELO|nr:hypothetical protein HPB48_026139 [Haemaphysalis longicornis]
MPTSGGLLEGQPVVVLRDTGCNTVIVNRSLVADTKLTGGMSTVQLLNRTCLSLPEADVEIDSPFFSGRVLASCMDDPLCDVIIGNIEGTGYYMNLASSSQLPQRGGSKAWLVSPKLGPDSALPRCISFAYYMFERTIDPAGPSLGSLRVHVLRDAAPGLFSLQAVWRLNNHQGHRWLVARCPIKLPDGNPIGEPYQLGETATGDIPKDSILFLALPLFFVPAAGYIFFDIFNQNSVQNPVLRSAPIPALEGETERCLSFWFAPFGRGESSTLSVFRAAEVPPSGDDAAPSSSGGAAAARTLLWRLSTRRMDTSRPDWRYGQVKVPADAPFKIHFEGEATDGGFALDDITMYDGNCESMCFGISAFGLQRAGCFQVTSNEHKKNQVAHRANLCV